MIKAEIEIKQASVNEVVNNLKGLRPLVLNAGVDGIGDVQEDIYRTARLLCPVQTGTLRSTLYMEQDIEGDKIRAIVAHPKRGSPYDRKNFLTGRMASTYARERHESPRTRKEVREADGTWKWLEKAVKQNKFLFLPTLAEYIKAALAGLPYEAAEQAIREYAIQFYEQRLASQQARKEKLRQRRAERRRQKGYTDEDFAKWKEQRRLRRGDYYGTPEHAWERKSTIVEETRKSMEEYRKSKKK